MNVVQLGMMKIGDKVVCNWGAMHPVENAVVVKVGCSDGVSNYSVIKFDDGTTMTVNRVEDRKVGVTGANGSPIGIYAA